MLRKSARFIFNCLFLIVLQLLLLTARIRRVAYIASFVREAPCCSFSLQLRRSVMYLYRPTRGGVGGGGMTGLAVGRRPFAAEALVRTQEGLECFWRTKWHW
jgi:hypothetical protein